VFNEAPPARVPAWLVRCLAIGVPALFAAGAHAGETSPEAAAPDAAVEASHDDASREQVPRSEVSHDDAPRKAGVTTSGSGRGGGYRVRHHRMTVDEQVDAATRRLALSDEQRARLRAILEQRRAEYARIEADGSLSGADRINRFRALEAWSSGQVQGLLTAEQQKLFREGSSAAPSQPDTQ
jgi:hypothetical protein